MTNREKAEYLNNKGFALFIDHVCWHVRDKAEWLNEDADDYILFWKELEKEIQLVKK